MDQLAYRQPAALLEREHELGSVRATLRLATRSEGALLVVEGSAGMGKTRLVDEARVQAPEVGVRVLHARATETEQGFPFGVMRQLFERVLLEADSGHRARWLAGAAALAADVLTGTPSMPATTQGSSANDLSYAWQHGLYWLATNLSADSPLALLVDDLQWCDAPSARALAFIARRLEGQPLVLILATRPLDPAATPEAAILAADPAVQMLRPSPLTEASVRALVSDRLSHEPNEQFVRACAQVTGGNPFLVKELLDEAAAQGLDPAVATAADVATMVPRGVANTVLLRLARLAPTTVALGRALSVLGDGAQIGDAARLAGITGSVIEGAVAQLVSAGIVESGGEVRFNHPILRTAIYSDLLSAERERLHRAAATTLRDRGASPSQVAAHVMHTEPAAEPGTVSLLRDTACAALALGDAAAAAALLSRALEEPPPDSERASVLLDLGLARARAGASEAIAPLSEIVERGQDEAAIVAAAIELSGMLFFAGRAAEGAAILRRAQERLPAAGPARDELEVMLLGASYTSASARRYADPIIATLRDPGGPARSLTQATTLGMLAMDEVMYLRSASKASDLARRAIAAGLPLELHRSGNWAMLALAALTAVDDFDAALRGTDEVLAQARQRGSALTVATISALRAVIGLRQGDLTAAAADAQAAIELVPDLLGAEYVSLAVSAAVLAGLERDNTPDSLRRLINDTGVQYDTEFVPSSQLRYASGVLRAAAGNHEAAIEELRGCELPHPTFGGENPAVLPWRSSAALSLAELGRHVEARTLAADELRRAQAFGAPRAIGIALRMAALVGPQAQRSDGLREALSVLSQSSARLEHARVLVDYGATLRAAGQRSAAREPLLEALTLATRCGARRLERTARAELGAIGIRPRPIDRTGTDSLTPSERRVVELAAGGSTNRGIAQTLFVTEKTVETHLGRAFRKLDISSRRQLRDVLSSASA